VVDDLLDYTADEQALGKPIASDLREGKVTLPIIRLLERDGTQASALVRGIVADRSVTAEQWRQLLDLLEATGGTESAYETATGYAARAKQRIVEAFPVSPERDALTSLVDYVVWRDR
jgi:octaprenyl-diphosphate synthase